MMNVTTRARVILAWKYENMVYLGGSKLSCIFMATVVVLVANECAI